MSTPSTNPPASAPKTDSHETPPTTQHGAAMSDTSTSFDTLSLQISAINRRLINIGDDIDYLQQEISQLNSEKHTVRRYINGFSTDMFGGNDQDTGDYQTGLIEDVKALRTEFAAFKKNNGTAAIHPDMMSIETGCDEEGYEEGKEEGYEDEDNAAIEQQQCRHSALDSSSAGPKEKIAARGSAA